MPSDTVDAALGDDEHVKAGIRRSLAGVDVATASIGSLRGGLEKALGLPAGALDPRKQGVNALIREVIAAEAASKRKAVEAGEGQPRVKRDKKDKKDKKNKKEGKTHDKDGRGPQAAAPERPECEAEPAPEQEGAPGAAAAAEAREAALPADAPVAPTAEAVDEAEELLGGMFADFTEEAASAAAAEAAEAACAGQVQPAAWAVSGGEDGTLRLWSLEDFTCPRVVEAHEGGVHTLVVDWAEMLALSGGADGCKLWELQRGLCRRSLPNTKDGCLSLAADRLREGRALGGCGDGSLQVWDLATGEATSSVASAHPGGVWSLDVAWERRRAASGGETSFKVWDTDRWECLFKIEDQRGGIMSLSVDWDNSSVLVASGLCGRDPRSLRLWNWTTQTAETLSGCEDTPANLAVDWDRGVAITGGWDAQLRTWCMERHLCTRTQRCDFGRVRSMAVDFGRKRALCGSSSGTLHFVDLQQERVLRVMEGHIGGVTTVCVGF